MNWGRFFRALRSSRAPADSGVIRYALERRNGTGRVQKQSAESKMRFLFNQLPFSPFQHTRVLLDHPATLVVDSTCNNRLSQFLD